jgi:hypothetical protein
MKSRLSNQRRWKESHQPVELNNHFVCRLIHSMTLKEQMIDVIQRLPEDASVERAIDELYLLAKIRIGIEQADAGQVISHEELKRQLLGEE